MTCHTMWNILFVTDIIMLFFKNLLSINIKQVRRQSFIEFKIFHKRWEKAAAEDKCWVDPYKEADKQSIPSFHLAGRAV